MKCKETLPELNDGTGGEVLVTMTQWAAIYHDCKTRHNGLVDAVKQ